MWKKKYGEWSRIYNFFKIIKSEIINEIYSFNIIIF